MNHMPKKRQNSYINNEESDNAVLGGVGQILFQINIPVFLFVG